MRKAWTWLWRGLVVGVLLVAAVAAWNHDRIKRLMAANSLFSEERIVGNFSNMGGMFFYEDLPVDHSNISPLPHAKNPKPLPENFEFNGRTIALAGWQKERAQTAMVVLKDGEIVYEEYFLGTGPEDLRISWSVAKSFLSAAFGIAISQGLIPDIDAKVTDYVPELAVSAYRDASIRNVLNMASGIEFNEDYLDFYSDINKMGRVLALGGSMDAFAVGQDVSSRPPGTAWQYNSIDTHVLGMVLRAATRQSVKQYLTENLLNPLGLEGPVYYLTDGFGVAWVLGGLNMRTRDYARFGLMMAQDGMIDGRQVVPAGWVRASTRQSAPAPAPGNENVLGYGYQWWVPRNATEGEFIADGVYSQHIYANRPLGVVIAMNAADRNFRGDTENITSMNVEAFRAIARALQ